MEPYPDSMFDTYPEAGYEDMSWYEICQAIDEYWHEYYRDEQQWLYENRNWFKDYV